MNIPNNAGNPHMQEFCRVLNEYLIANGMRGNANSGREPCQRTLDYYFKKRTPEAEDGVSREVEKKGTLDFYFKKSPDKTTPSQSSLNSNGSDSTGADVCTSTSIQSNTYLRQTTPESGTNLTIQSADKVTFFSSGDLLHDARQVPSSSMVLDCQNNTLAQNINTIDTPTFAECNENDSDTLFEKLFPVSDPHDLSQASSGRRSETAEKVIPTIFLDMPSEYTQNGCEDSSNGSTGQDPKLISSYLTEKQYHSSESNVANLRSENQENFSFLSTPAAMPENKQSSDICCNILNSDSAYLAGSSPDQTLGAKISEHNVMIANGSNVSSGSSEKKKKSSKKKKKKKRRSSDCESNLHASKSSNHKNKRKHSSKSKKKRNQIKGSKKKRQKTPSSSPDSLKCSILLHPITSTETKALNENSEVLEKHQSSCVDGLVESSSSPTGNVSQTHIPKQEISSKECRKSLCFDKKILQVKVKRLHVCGGEAVPNNGHSKSSDKKRSKSKEKLKELTDKASANSKIKNSCEDGNVKELSPADKISSNSKNYKKPTKIKRTRELSNTRCKLKENSPKQNKTTKAIVDDSTVNNQISYGVQSTSDKRFIVVEAPQLNESSSTDSTEELHAIPIAKRLRKRKSTTQQTVDVEIQASKKLESGPSCKKQLQFESDIVEEDTNSALSLFPSSDVEIMNGSSFSDSARFKSARPAEVQELVRECSVVLEDIARNNKLISIYGNLNQIKGKSKRKAATEVDLSSPQSLPCPKKKKMNNTVISDAVENCISLTPAEKNQLDVERTHQEKSLDIQLDKELEATPNTSNRVEERTTAMVDESNFVNNMQAALQNLKTQQILKDVKKNGAQPGWMLIKPHVSKDKTYVGPSLYLLKPQFYKLLKEKHELIRNNHSH